MRSAKIFLSALALILCCNQAKAQSGIQSASANPTGKQFSVTFSTGSVAVADHSTQRIYITNQNGQQYEVTFTEAAASAEPDPTKREQLLQGFQASLSDPEHMASIRAARIATDDSFWAYDMCGEFACIESFAAPEDRSSTSLATGLTSDCDYLCDPQLMPPCDFGPCHPNRWADGSMYYSGFGAGWDSDEGGGTITRQEFIAYDKSRFENARQDACGDKNVLTGETMAIGAGTVYACATVATGLGAVACAGGIVTYGYGLYKIDKANKQCQAQYPGPGKW